MIDVMNKLKEIAESGYDNEDIQRGIDAAATQKFDEESVMERGKQKKMKREDQKLDNDEQIEEELMGQFGEGAGEYSYTLEYNGEENGYSKHKLTITSPEGETKEVADDFTYFDTENPEELQAELESWFHKGMGVADASVDEDLQRMRELAGLGEMLGKDGKKPGVPYSKSTQKDLDDRIAVATPPKDDTGEADAEEGETARFLRHMKQIKKVK